MTIDFRVIFVPGKKNTLPDGLSRFPILGPSIYEAEPVPLLSVKTVTTSESTREELSPDSDRPVHLSEEEAASLVESLAGMTLETDSDREVLIAS